MTNHHADDDPTWPYASVDVWDAVSSDPAWECPALVCSCHPDRDPATQTETFSLLLCDEAAARMPGARCRVLAQGILVNEDNPNADPHGRITLETRRLPEQVLVEWAPAGTPLEPRYPFRRLYHVTLPDHDAEEAARRRLHNLGFSARATLAGNVRDFQAVYGQTGAGDLAAAGVELVNYHDDGVDRPAGHARQSLTVAAPAPQAPSAGKTGKLAPAIAAGLVLEAIAFPSNDRRALFEESSELKTGNIDLHGLKHWGKGSRESAGVAWDWEQGTSMRDPCLLRDTELVCNARFRWHGGAPINVGFAVTPTIDGDKVRLGAALANGTIAAQGTLDISFTFFGTLPNHVGQLALELRWVAGDSGGGAAFDFDPVDTKHVLFTRFGEPLLPDKDDSAAGTPAMDGTTVTGTTKRLKKLARLIDTDLKHGVDSAALIERMLWNIHRGINDRIGAPPPGRGGPTYFDAALDAAITDNGQPAPRRLAGPVGSAVVVGGNALPLTEQWLMWVNTSDAEPTKYWNVASCIGHVQLFRTMVATLGINVRRVWVLPKTESLPDGTRRDLFEADLFSLGELDDTRVQNAMLRDGSGALVEARVRLMEPGGKYENFEGCARTPQGKLLPGGYAVGRITPDAPHFLTHRGFRTAHEVLTWWVGTKRQLGGTTFQRFLAWVHTDAEQKPTDCWDVDGKHYPIADFQKIFDTGKHLPPPPKR
jgi:hypothetical protein